MQDSHVESEYELDQALRIWRVSLKDESTGEGDTESKTRSRLTALTP